MEKTKMEMLVDTARWVYAWQSQSGLTDAQMLRKYPGLGSAKTYRDIRDGKAEPYDCERWLAEYGVVRSEIEMRDNDQREEPVMADLSTVVQVRRAALGAMATHGSNRVVIATGGSGSGKSFALRGLRGFYGSRIQAIEALDVWGDKPGDMLGAILEALGKAVPVGASVRMRKVQEALRRSRTMIAVDEAQHLGPHCINTIKALVNTTPGEFLLLAMGTLWDRLESIAWQEAAQISKNRLHERVELALDLQDIMRYINGRFAGMDIAKRELGAMAQVILPAADDNGNLSFVRDVCDAVVAMVGEGVVPTRDEVVDAVGAVSVKRVKKAK